MAVSKSSMLDADELNDLDALILDYLRDEGRATPMLLKLELEAAGHSPGVRQNINSRMTRLAEHGHISNLHDTGVYELTNDPRKTADER